MQSAVGSVEAPAGLTDSDLNRRVLLGSAMLPFAEAIVDEPLQPGDLADLSRAEDAIYSGRASRLNGNSTTPRFCAGISRYSAEQLRLCGLAWH